MLNKQIPGIHHVTAIASDPQRNVDFYTNVLGLRLVKVTVNFDDPTTYLSCINRSFHGKRTLTTS
jgi:glyoxalase family protein